MSKKINQKELHVEIVDDIVVNLLFSGEITIESITTYQHTIEKINFAHINKLNIDLSGVEFVDTAGGIFIDALITQYKDRDAEIVNTHVKEDIVDTIALVQRSKTTYQKVPSIKKDNPFILVGKKTHSFYLGFLSFMLFLNSIILAKIHYLKSPKNIRIKEIMFEINESGVKALGIIALTSFLVGLVVAYQSAYQLKIYGANIFIVDMIGISMLRELSPLITAIVIAGRSGSAFTAQIGAMKITEELDAMRTMGFDPYTFLVLPRIIALMLVMPILIFVSDMMGVMGGMLVANIDLNITTSLFLDRFSSEVDIKHFYIGIIKGPFFAFLIASIGIYRGLRVKNDTQSIGFNTTKSVVESIFAVIVCDAIFSIILTNMGI